MVGPTGETNEPRRPSPRAAAQPASQLANQPSSREALILFDIDGTLLMAGDRAHGTAFIHAFERVYGRPVTLEGVTLAGMLDANIARVLFEHHALDMSEADARLHEMMTAMGEHYVEAMLGRDLRERLLPGVTEAVLACHQRGWAAGVLTGNGEAVARSKLRLAGLDLLLPFGAYGDLARERGHLVEAAIEAAEAALGARYRPEQTVLVGDTPADIGAARLAGAGVVAVATGRFDSAALAAHDPDVVLADLANTDAFVAAVERILAS
jgi:phosphoglycolate phosphatase-like HAD superfamily hydrolase